MKKQKINKKKELMPLWMWDMIAFGGIILTMCGFVFGMMNEILIAFIFILLGGVAYVISNAIKSSDEREFLKNVK